MSVIMSFATLQNSSKRHMAHTIESGGRHPELLE